MTFEDTQTYSQWKSAEALGVAPIDRFDPEPATLPRFDFLLDTIELAMNTPEGIQGEMK